jgi:ABC-2 type transport system ATP-binding protein
MVIHTQGLSYHYRRGVDALHNVSLAVPAGAVLGLLGPNGAGKTTLLQCLVGLRRASAGQITVLGHDVRTREPITTGQVGYVAEGVRLPEWMTLSALERWVAPLYPKWDHALADQLRDSFRLSGSRKIRTLSRGEHMKAALLIALAPRPALLCMDEPFTGVDVTVKDALVRGLLSSVTDVGTTIVIASHDLAELELLVDHVAMLSAGRLVLSGTAESVRERFQRVTITAADSVLDALRPEPQWLQVERARRRMSFVADEASGVPSVALLSARVPEADDIAVEPLSLKDVFVTVAQREELARGRAA